MLHIGWKKLDFGKLFIRYEGVLSRLNIQDRVTSVHPLILPDAHVLGLSKELMAKMSSGNPC